jgi:hypothetical protein
LGFRIDAGGGQGCLRTSEQELHIFGGKFLQRLVLVFVDSASDEIRLFLLKLDNSGFDRIFDGEPGNHTWPLLANPVTTIRTLPFRRGVPPSA